MNNQCPVCDYLIPEKLIKSHSQSNIDEIVCPNCGYHIKIQSWTVDLTECPYCGQVKDREAYQCRWCHGGGLSGMVDLSLYKPPKYYPKSYFKKRGLI